MKAKKKATIHRIEKKPVGWGKTKSKGYNSSLDFASITSWLQVCNERELKKYEPDDLSAHKAFVKDGYVIYKNAYPNGKINEIHKVLWGWYNQLEGAHKEGKIDKNVHGWSISILSKFEKSKLYEDFIENLNTIKIMKGYLGPDICVLGYDALWINTPDNDDPVLLKGQHTDAWTGTSVNTIFAKTCFTDVDKFNSMCVSPGSHTNGLVPVRNREIDPMYNVKYENLNLDCLVAGDILLWHPLLIHATSGYSDKNTRISITSRYASTESPFSSQERALGYRTVSIGPMNQVLRIVGNDHLLPFRTEGGFVGVDRRMSKIYGHSDYKSKKDYEDFLE
jgi:hypothetical protein